MHVVFVTLEIRPDRLDDFTAAIRANREASLRDEPGCLRFDVLRSADDPLVFHFYEIYTDRDAFETAHRSAPHYRVWQEAAARCVLPGSHENTHAEPLFADQIAEAGP